MQSSENYATNESPDDSGKVSALSTNDIP